MANAGRRGIALLGIVISFRLVPWTFVGRSFTSAAPQRRLAQGRHTRAQHVQRHSRAIGRGGSPGTYCKEFRRYADNRMYMTAAVRMIARQDMILSQSDLGGDIGLLDRPVTYGAMQTNLRQLEDELRSPRVRELRDELNEAVTIIRDALTIELDAKLEPPKTVRDRMKEVRLIDKQRWFGPDIVGVEDIVRMAVLCKGEDEFDIADIETWLDAEENSILSFFKASVPESPESSEGSQEAEALEEFLKTIGPEFEGKAEMILNAAGVADLEELLDLVEDRSDLADLDKPEVGMKVLHVKKLFKAILREKERRASELEA